MGSKAEYEARKGQRIAEYEARQERFRKMDALDSVIREKTATIELLSIADRFVTAVERIADAMEEMS